MKLNFKKKNPLHSISILLFPIALIYGLVTWVRNKFYDWGLFKQASFAIPIIGVGNLVVGGSGKTPHTEYLLRLLNPFLNVGILSRGYGRNTAGWRMVTSQNSSDEVGDEPLLFKLKYPSTPVFVGENRVLAIPQSLQKQPETNTLICDDIYQHRSLKPFINILLTEYDHPYSYDFILPVGSLRESKNGSKRADAVIVTKCPENFSTQSQIQFKKHLKLEESQHLFFSTLRYENPYRLFNSQERITLNQTTEIILFSALASTNFLIEYLKKNVKTIHSVEFPDHYRFKEQDVARLQQTYNELNVESKIILITEKDAVKLLQHQKFIQINNLPIYILPAEVKFLESSSITFDNYIKDKILHFEV